MIYNKCKNINYMKKNYEIAKNDYLQKLTQKIYNYYSSDMGTWFDEIQGNEQELWQDIYNNLENEIFLKCKNCTYDMLAMIENYNFYKNIYRGIYGKKIQ